MTTTEPTVHNVVWDRDRDLFVLSGGGGPFTWGQLILGKDADGEPPPGPLPVSPLSEPLTFLPTNTYDIGTDTIGKPRDVFVGRDLHVAGNLMVNGYSELPSARITALLTPSPAAGKGMELLFHPTARIGYVQCIDRDEGVQLPFQVNAATATFSGDLIVTGKIFGGPVAAIGSPGDISANRGGDVGTLYFGGLPSAYLHYAGGAFHFSGGNINMPANLGVVGQLTASYIISNTNIDIQGGNIYFAANAAIHLTWNGGGFKFSHYVATDVNHIYFAWSTWPGAIFVNWDGIGISHSHQIRGPAIYTSGLGQFDGRLVTNGYDAGWGNNLGGDTACSGGMYAAGGFNAYHGAVTAWGLYIANIADHRGQGIGYAWPVHSIRANKANIGPLRDALAIVQNDALHAIEYDTRPETLPDSVTVERRSLRAQHSLGFAAEDWEPIVPEVCARDPDGSLVGLDYDRIGAITFEAVKQLAEEVATLRARVAELEGRLT